MLLILLFISFFPKADVPDEVQQIFDTNCVECHSGNNPSGGLSYADAATSESQLVNMAANCDNNQTRVIPGDPDNSVLYRKISMANPGCGAAMPFGRAMISIADQAIIYNWIVSIGPAAQFGLVEMESNQSTVQETDGQLNIAVNRLLGTQGQISVDYVVSTLNNDSATSPDDYIADSGTLVFEDGEVVKNITVILSDDEIFEGSETFSVTLSNVTNGAVLGSLIQNRVNIVDNEFDNKPGTFLFGSLAYSVYESDESFEVTILRSFGAAGSVSVDLISSDGSAFSGIDYTLVNQTLIFAEGEKSQVVTIVLLDDQEEESTESFVLNISNPSNEALIGGVSQVTVSISDDDSDDSSDDSSEDDEGNSDDSTGGDTSVEPTEPEEAEYTAAGSLYLLPLMLLVLVFFRVR